MPTSSVLTAKILNSPDPLATREAIWSKTRYLVAHKAKTDTFSGTDTEHYQGRHVLPGPLANDELCPTMANMDIDYLESQLGITFIDYATTEGADASVIAAPYGVMSSSEADDYEFQLAELLGIALPEGHPRKTKSN